MNMQQAVTNVVKENATIDNAIQDILMKHYGLTSKDQPAAYMAYGMMAMEVAMALVNMFLALKNPSQHRSYKAFCDLTYQLNTNDFWNKNASILLPAVHVALNAYRDGGVLMLEREVRNEYSSDDALIAASRVAPLELFPLIAYCIGGPPLMLQASIPLKTELATYFL